MNQTIPCSGSENSLHNSRKRRVAHVCAVDMTANCGLRAQLEGLRDAGYDVSVVCRFEKYRDKLQADGFHVIDLDVSRAMTPLKDIKSLWQLYRVFRKNRFDIVHTHTPKISLLGQMAAYFAGVPVIFDTVHGFYFHDNMPPIPRNFYILMAKIAARFSIRILSQSDEDVDTAIKLNICRPEKIRQLGNGLDIERFCRSRFPNDFGVQKRKELGIPTDAFVVGIVGRMVREKGYLELCQAVSILVKKGHKVFMLAIGGFEPEKSDALKPSDAGKYGIEKNSIFCGTRFDVDELMAAMDIYTLPSYREGYPRSVIEASAMSLPVVATNIRGCREAITDGVTGILVPPRNPVALAEAIEKLINDKDLRFTMGQAGRKRAETTFDERNVVEIVLSEYKKVITGANDG